MDTITGKIYAEEFIGKANNKEYTQLLITDNDKYVSVIVEGVLALPIGTKVSVKGDTRTYRGLTEMVAKEIRDV